MEVDTKAHWQPMQVEVVGDMRDVLKAATAAKPGPRLDTAGAGGFKKGGG